ncbi:hypothetical protein OJAV_G00013110 [Oryzias javanicus]|uniref:Membrane-associated ring finger (C3HC4) 7 n=1 Tax=Oryzias javanicus TaxID=123683 RepID=A0A3S2PGE0_ORYJA|nr:hypothetical protein OJAV_G00013110 [Oryzias javanicus]
MAAADRRAPLLWLLLVSCLDGAVRAAPSSSSSSSSSTGDNGLTAALTDTDDPRRVPTPTSQTAGFALRVLVRDQVTRQLLPGASVGLYVNHTLRGSAQTDAAGAVLLWVQYDPGSGLTLLGTKEGYVPAPLPWSTAKRPIFSAVTMSLLPHSQGNIWLFEDSVLITRKLPESSSEPKVRFPKSLLTLPDGGNLSSVAAFLTVPQHHLGKDCANCTLGIASGKSASRSVELKAVAAVSVLLFSGGVELHVRGPIQISLPLGRHTALRAADTVPAWAFNLKTGAWENHGLGVVKAVGDELAWVYTASHLGYWIAAPHPSSKGYLDWRGILGGTLAVVVGFLSLLLCHCGGAYREPRRRRRRRTARFSKLTVLKKDQTTSTHMEEGLLFRSGDNSLASCSVQCETLSTPRHKANYNIYVEDPGGLPAGSLYDNIVQQASLYINSDEVARIQEKAEQNRANLNSSDNFFQDKLVHLYNQPVAIIQAPELFAAQEQLSGCKSATFPRNGVDYDDHAEPANRDGYTQTLPKAPHHHCQGGAGPHQSNPDDPQPLETPPPGQGPGANMWGRYNNLLESSVSVPGTLNEAAGMGPFSGAELQGISERTLLELGRGKSSHPRAWFVSLDGKPAAQVRHSIIELQSRHRPPSSNDTSLDSGVDMNEPQQSLRESERDRPSARGASLHLHGRGGRHGEEQDLSSSESGTTATCTPEDPSLRNILDGSSGAIPNIPEERDGMDTSSAQEDSESRGTPPPRRLRKVREKVKTDKRSAKHVREGRLLTKRS